MSDAEVVAFELPKLPGVRKQSFHVIDRTLTKAPRVARQETERVPKRLAGKLALLLDGVGALRAVASCRSRLLFEGGPVLFFADVPSARLKARPANKLRRDLVGIGAKACVLRAADDVTTLMAWPAGEDEITAFVVGAVPDHRLHADFFGSPALAAKPRGASARAAKPVGDREARLLQEIAVLQGQVATLTRAQSAVGAMEQLGLDDARLKRMLVLLHPDKHASSAAATEAAQWVNGMRELLKGK